MSDERTARWISRTDKFATLQWPLGKLPTSLVAAVEDAAEVPGVRLYPCGNMLEVSRSAARVLGTLWARLGVEDPFRARSQARLPLVKLARPLYAHQREAAEWLVANGGGLLADAMGVGKSAAAACGARTLAGAGRVVIIGPRYVRDTWARELVALGLMDSVDDLGVATGLTPDTAVLRGRVWWFIHYQIAHAWLGHMRLGAGCPVVAIVDEAHWVRNPKSRMGSAVQALAGVAKHRILLTGTPLPHRVADLWALVTMVEGTAQWGTRFDFRVRYAGAVPNGYGWEDRGTTNEDELRERLSYVYMRRRPEDIPALDVPPLSRELVMVERSPEDPKALVKAWDRIAAAQADLDLDMQAILDGLEHGTLGADLFAALAALRKASASVKIPTTVKKVAGLLASGASVVVFTWQRRTAESVAKQAVTAATKLMVVGPEAYVIHGGASQASRDRDVADFQSTGGVLCATIDALREGVTLTAATHVVIHDLTWGPADILQAEARVARIGQTQPCVAWWMVARGSIDDAMAVHLVRKVAAQAHATGDMAGEEALAAVGLSTKLLEASRAIEEAIERWEQRT